MILRKYKWHLLIVAFLLLIPAFLTMPQQKQPAEANDKALNFDEIRKEIEKQQAEDLIKQLQDVIDEIQTKLDNKDTELNSDELLLRTLYNNSSLRLKMAAVAGLCGNPKFIDIYIDAINQTYSWHLRQLGIQSLEDTVDERAIPPFIEGLKNAEWRASYKSYEDAAKALSTIAFRLPEKATQIIQNATSLVKDPKVDITAKAKLITDTLTPLTYLASAKKEATQALLSIMRDETIHWELRFYAAEKIILAVSWDLVSEAEAREAVEFCTSVFESIMLGAPEPLKDVELSPHNTSKGFVEIGKGYAVRNLQFKPYAELAIDVIGEVRIPAYKGTTPMRVAFSISLYDLFGKYLGGEQFSVYGVAPKGGIYPFEVSLIGIPSKSVDSCQIRPQGAWEPKEDKQPLTVSSLDELLRNYTSTGIYTAPSTVEFERLDGVAIIVADDGQYLGKISSSTIDSDSIMNSIGRYGSSISSTSIFNEIGRYGGKISRMSPFNDIASSPPKIFVGNTFIAYLTTNSLKRPRVDPYALIGYLKSK